MHARLHSHLRTSGFTLIELLVGLLIGLIAGVAILSATYFFEDFKRTQFGTSAAADSSVLAMLAIGRDIKGAGVGVAASGRNNQSTIICPALNAYFNGVLIDNAAIAPVWVTRPGGVGASDTISIAGASSIGAAAPIALSTGMATGTDPLNVPSAQGITIPGPNTQGSVLLVSAYSGNGSVTAPCTVMQVSGTTLQANSTQIAHAAGSGNWNPPATVVFSNPQAYGAGASVMNAGAFTWTTYQVNNATATLQLVDQFASAGTPATPLAENVVYMRAQYGVVAGTGLSVAQWVDATGAWAWPLSAASMSQIRAIRVGLVTRIPAAVKPSGGPGAACDATTAATLPVIFAATASPLGAAVTADLSATQNWQCYRYRTQSLVIPLKNIVFGEQ
ncbi:PilW family protein [Cupriavidus basilensis]|uniref:PilW family protein n=1 Tax=Cupriavidus basilensis TaxID=68895 RepID=A0A643G1J3_9BURK|nr:PilW family protein [Cupriavidus basilensis]QOT75577.1 PilW family protein [Cupriavidus basilensis]